MPLKERGRKDPTAEVRMKEKNIINPQSSAFLWERSDRRILHRTEKRLVRDYEQRKQFGSKALHGVS
jgi:hypothetical protein